MSGESINEHERQDAPRTPVYHFGCLAIATGLALLLFQPFSTKTGEAPYCTPYLYDTGKIAASRLAPMTPPVTVEQNPATSFKQGIVALNHEPFRHIHSIETFREYVAQVDALVVQYLLEASTQGEEHGKRLPPEAVLHLPWGSYPAVFGSSASSYFASQLKELQQHARYVGIHHYATELYGVLQSLYLQLKNAGQGSIYGWGSKDGTAEYPRRRNNSFSSEEKAQQLEALRDLAKANLRVDELAPLGPPKRIEHFDWGAGQRGPSWY